MREFPAGFCITGLQFDDGDNLALLTAPKGMKVAGIFTTNTCPAHPVQLSKKNIDNSVHRAILVNSGSANAATGDTGKKIMLDFIKKIASKLEVMEDEILISSTGVIGKPPIYHDSNINSILTQKDNIDPYSFADSIMTTDTRRKIVSRVFELNSKNVTILAIAKGSGMIAPSLATMLAFIITDAAIEKTALTKALKKAANVSFNCLNIDGETSTNDTVFLASSCRAGNRPITSSGYGFRKFYNELEKTCILLTEKLAADGEGATKFIKIEIRGASNKSIAKKAAKIIAQSPLCKTAFYGASPNWGRIISALGSAGINFDLKKFSLFINGVPWVKRGIPQYKMWEDIKTVMQGARYKLEIDLGSGNFKSVSYTCDFSPEYVRINAHYLT